MISLWKSLLIVATQASTSSSPPMMETAMAGSKLSARSCSLGTLMLTLYRSSSSRMCFPLNPMRRPRDFAGISTVPRTLGTRRAGAGTAGPGGAYWAGAGTSLSLDDTDELDDLDGDLLTSGRAAALGCACAAGFAFSILFIASSSNTTDRSARCFSTPGAGPSSSTCSSSSSELLGSSAAAGGWSMTTRSLPSPPCAAACCGNRSGSLCCSCDSSSALSPDQVRFTNKTLQQTVWTPKILGVSGKGSVFDLQPHSPRLSSRFLLPSSNQYELPEANHGEYSSCFWGLIISQLYPNYYIPIFPVMSQYC